MPTPDELRLNRPGQREARPATHTITEAIPGIGVFAIFPCATIS